MGKSILNVDPIVCSDADLEPDFTGFRQEEDDFEWGEDDFFSDDLDYPEGESFDDDDF